MAWYHKAGNFLKEAGRYVPVVGDVIDAVDPKTVDPNSIDMGQKDFDESAQMSNQAFNRAMNLAYGGQPMEHQAGTIRDFDVSGGNALQGRQVQNLNSAQAAAEGKGPMIGSLAHQMNLARLNREQLGAASANRGSERAGGRREAMLNIGERGAESGLQGAILDAQETANNRRAYTDALSTARQQDSNLAVAGATGRMNRDIGQENANRSAYDSTRTAIDRSRGLDISAVNAATGATGQRTSAAYGTSDAKQKANKAAADKEAVNDARRAGIRKMIKQVAADGIKASFGIPPTGGGLDPDGVMPPSFAAHGGVVTQPTNMVVGEAGPEIIIPLSGRVPEDQVDDLDVDDRPFSKRGGPTLAEALALVNRKGRKAS